MSDEFKLTKPQAQALVDYFELINHTQTWPDGTFDSEVAYIDELAAAVESDTAFTADVHAVAIRCRKLVAAVRGSEGAKAILDLGCAYRLLISKLGPDAATKRSARLLREGQDKSNSQRSIDADPNARAKFMAWWEDKYPQHDATVAIDWYQCGRKIRERLKRQLTAGLIPEKLP